MILEMLEICHTSFCMIHGNEKAKQKATYIVKNIRNAIEILEKSLKE